MLSFLTSKKVQDLTDKIGKLFKDLPHLPSSLIEFLVKVAPWLVALGGIFSLFGSLSNLRWVLGQSPARRWVDEFTGFNTSYYLIMAVIQIAMAWLALEAFKPLKERQNKGWLYLFWINLLSLAGAIVGFIFAGGSPAMMVISVALGFYVLYEVRAEYKDKTEKTKTQA